MSDEPTSVHLDVEGGSLHALRWGAGPRVAVAVHGITANAMSWRRVAALLPEDWSLVALDQRGRGRSRDLPGPYAVEDLARDAAAAVTATGAEVLVGHSLGAYVAVAVAHRHPGVTERIVLVDGGIAIPVPLPASDEEADALVVAALGPMLERLGRDFSREEYVGLFRSHPAMAPTWNDDLLAYAEYDAVPSGSGVRAAASPEAVRVSGRELLLRGAEIADAWRSLPAGTTLLTAPRGMTDDPAPFLPPAAVAEALRAAPGVRQVEVDDTNHYTILLGRGADAVAAAVVGDIVGG